MLGAFAVSVVEPFDDEAARCVNAHHVEPLATAALVHRLGSTPNKAIIVFMVSPA